MGQNVGIKAKFVSLSSIRAAQYMTHVGKMSQNKHKLKFKTSEDIDFCPN